jgi:hypothetical protein
VTHNITSFVITLKSLNTLLLPTLTPTYTNSENAWLSIETSNVTISGIVIYHSYNYSSWLGGLENSAPLFLLKSDSVVEFDRVLFTTLDPTLLVYNPIIVGSGSNSTVNIKNSSFTNINLSRASLIYDYWTTSFNLLNDTFRYNLIS